MMNHQFSQLGTNIVSGIALTALLLSVPLPADTLILTNGQKQIGIAEENEIDKTKIFFTTVGGRLGIPRSRIKEIIYDTPANSRIALGDEFYKISKYEEAWAEYKAATTLEPDNKIAQERLASAYAKVREIQQGANEELMAEARVLLADARTLAAESKYEEAHDKIRSAEARAGALIEDEARQALAELYISWGYSRLDRLDDVGAVEKFETAIQYGSDNQEIKEVLLKTYKRIPERRAEALDIYREKLLKEPDNTQYKYEVIDLLSLMERTEEMTDMLIDLRRTGPLKEEKYTKLLHDGLLRRVRQAIDDRDYGAARDFYTLVLEYFPNYDRQYLFFFEFYERANQIDPNSYKDQIELAKYAQVHNLEGQAKERFQAALKIDPEGTEALEALQQMAQAELIRAREQADSPDPNAHYFAITRAKRIIEEYPNSQEIVEHARTTIEIAQNKIQEDMRARQRSAKDIAATGDDYYERALGFLNEAQSVDFNDQVRVYNPTNEASANLQRAINAWNTALQLDPSLAQLQNGDLSTKIADAQRLLSSISSPLPSLGARREFSRQRSN